MNPPLTDCRFYVEIDGINQAVFTEVASFQVETDMQEILEGGHNSVVHRLPGRVKVGTLTLKRGLTRSNDFYTWCARCAWGMVERRNVSVSIYNPAGERVLRWDFLRAWPRRWSSPQLTADGRSVAIETLELAHDGLWWL